MIQDLVQCIAVEHDYRLVLLAALICLFAAYTTVALLQRARESSDRARRHWTVLTALAAGCGVWATHFVAMIAYDPGLPVAYDVVITILSVIVAVSVIWLGISVYIYQQHLTGRILAGTLIGLGIAAMHYTGMAAVRLQGTISYDLPQLFAGIGLGILFSILTLVSMQRRSTEWHLLQSAGLLMLAICALHFIGMTAVQVQYDPTVGTPGFLASKTFLVLGVTLVAGLLLAMTLTSALIDRHMAANFEEEATRLRGLANAAIEGVVLLDDAGRILDANASFLHLTGRRVDVLKGLSFRHCFRNMTLEDGWAATNGENGREAVIIHASGEENRVEILFRRLPEQGLSGPVAIVRDRGAAIPVTCLRACAMPPIEGIVEPSRLHPAGHERAWGPLAYADADAEHTD
jgi:PAS domain S-box-containing protein